MPVTYRQQKIDIETQRDLHAWASELGVSAHHLVMAVKAVGSSVEDVKAYLKASQEPIGVYVDRMRSRLDEIEIQFQQLSEERRNIVSFLEGFAQLQRTQRQSETGILVTVTARDESGARPDYRKNFEELGLRNASRHASIGPSALVVDVVYQLLSDGKRRSLQEILSFLEVRGIPLRGANQAGFLSTLLSRDHRFDASRRDGWGLTEQHG